MDSHSFALKRIHIVRKGALSPLDPTLGPTLGHLDLPLIYVLHLNFFHPCINADPAKPSPKLELEEGREEPSSATSDDSNSSISPYSSPPYLSPKSRKGECMYVTLQLVVLFSVSYY